ncbi:ATP-binding protein [Thioclava sp. FTW29]|uniref:histidine kinase n=1 Tax=Thioclava litoralis TaxID=3076557 RepID=A0ABZ1E363_9RHOB|nr:ATP-binding protein [Thioclava sp. FTW29]
MTQTDSASWWRWGPALLGAGCTLCLLALYLVADHQLSKRLAADAATDAHMRVLAIASELARQKSVGAVLATDQGIIGTQQDATPAQWQRLSERLEELNADINASVIYVTNVQGVAVAASNWRDEASFVGTSYGYRSYIRDALQTGEGREYALGSVSHQPGLYLSRRIGGAQAPLGVVVVKLTFDVLENGWRGSDHLAWITDRDGRVTLTSDPALRFGPSPVRGPVTVSEAVPGSGWQLHLHVAPWPAHLLAGAITAGGALVMAALWLAHRTFRRRQRVAAQYRDRLERDVETRTLALTRQIREREEAEAQLAGMQAALVQANKLASLGQISAGVAHEINQPLSTIRLLAEYGQDAVPAGQQHDPLRDNLRQIVEMSHRIGTITSDLRGFARKSRGNREPVSLRAAWQASLRLAASRRATEAVGISAPEIPEDLLIDAESVRLEQVLVNLIQNAQEALSGRSDGRIWLEIVRHETQISLYICDNGPGLAPMVARAPFTPFQTTKATGLGLGLVICQSILRDFGGDLSYDPAADRTGARWRMDLTLWEAR